MTEALVLLGIAISAVAYFVISARLFRQTRRLADHIPISGDGGAAVKSQGEFSASTVATTISLATVILAYAELAGYLGLWLLWTVITTVLGIVVVRLTAPKIWRHLQSFPGHRPTLHEFLGHSFGSDRLKQVTALCTSLGFLGALAVELTVGARFLAALVPSIPAVLAVVGLSAIGIGYTLLGGFRAVVLTDRIQMSAIWVAIAALFALLFWLISSTGGWQGFASRIPPSMIDFSWREGLATFLIGIAVINIPTFLADMGMWQRIAATQRESDVETGLLRSAVSAFASWTCLALLACGIVVLVPATGTDNPIAGMLRLVGEAGGILLGIALVIVICGLYAASLSTASTQLIAAGQTLHIDLLRPRRNGREATEHRDDLRFARLLLIAIAVSSVVLVEGLRAVGFSIADLVFAVYGAQLGLVPLVVLGLFGKRDHTLKMGRSAAIAAIIGFIAGWATAGYGKATSGDSIVFLAPVASLFASSLICLLGYLSARRN